MGMARQDRAAAGGAPKEALLKVYRELGRDRCGERTPAGSKMPVRRHNGLPLKRGHLLGSLKAPKALQGAEMRPGGLNFGERRVVGSVDLRTGS